MMPPLPPLPVPVPELPLIALFIPIWIGISPHGYNVRGARATSENALDLHRDESAGNNANESDVVIANSQDTDVAARTRIQNAAVVVVGVKRIRLARSHNVRAQSQRVGIVDRSDRSHGTIGRVVYDVANQVGGEVLSGIHQLADRGRGSRTGNGRAPNIRDVDGVAVDYSEGAARLKLLICHYLKGKIRLRVSRRLSHPQPPLVALSTTYLTPVALVTFSTASPSPFMPPS